MTTLQTLEIALDALLQVKPLYSKHDAITALRTQIALEKMAENERQLGIQMQPDEFKCPYCYDHPAAQWVGLTDEEKRQILLDDPIDWINTIEDKLKQKNT